MAASTESRDLPVASLRVALAAATVMALALVAVFREPLPFATSIQWRNVGFAALPFAIAAFAYTMPRSMFAWCAGVGAAAAALLFLAATSIESLAAWLLFLAATTGIGARWLDPAKHRPIYRALLAHLIGTACVGLVLSLTLALRIHSQTAYLVGLLGVSIAARRELAAIAVRVWEERRRFGNLQQRADRSTFALAASVGLLGSLGALGAIASYDDLAYHLRLPYELLHNGSYNFDFRHQVWATSPWISDLVFAVPFIVSGGDEGIHLWLKVMQHFGTGVLLYATARTLVSRAPAFCIVALWFSTPLALVLTHTQHTELFSALVAIALFYFWSQPQFDDVPTLAAVALLIALLAAIKASNLPLCAAIALLFARRSIHVARASNAKSVMAALVPAMLLCLYPYATAWIRTGNPIFPLFNAFFASPYFPLENFANEAYSGHLDWALPLDLFIRTPVYLETMKSFAGGLQYVLLTWPVVLLLRCTDRVPLAALGIALGFSAAILFSQQYLRYLFPVMPLFCLALAVWWLGPSLRRFATAVSCGCMAINLYVMPGIHWQTGEAVLWNVSAEGRERYLREYAPERLLNRVVDADRGADAVVLYSPLAPFGAEIRGSPLYANWYNLALWHEAVQVKSDADVAAFLAKHRITHVMLPPTNSVIAGESAPFLVIRPYLERNAQLQGMIGHTQLYRLSPRRTQSTASSGL